MNWVCVSFGINGPVSNVVLQYVRLCLDDLLFQHRIAADLNGKPGHKVGNIIGGCNDPSNVFLVNTLAQEAGKGVLGKLVGSVKYLITVSEGLEQDVFGVSKFTCRIDIHTWDYTWKDVVGFNQPSVDKAFGFNKRYLRFWTYLGGFEL